MELKILYGLHRPFHQPLWMVKWVCAFLTQRKTKKQGYFVCPDITADFYFVMLDWLSDKYPDCYNGGIPSRESVISVRNKFSSIPKDDRLSYLRSVLQKKRVSKIEKQIYSTYKASGYYINLTKEKLNLINDNGNITVGNFPSKYWKIPNLYKSEKIVILMQILRYDAIYFLSLCLLHKEANKYELSLSELIYDFLKEFYPNARFDFISRSHHNYYIVRKYWGEMLGVLTKSNGLSSFAKQVILSSCDTQKAYNDIIGFIKVYRPVMKRQQAFSRLVTKFNRTYSHLIQNQEKINEYVNLHDICSAMGMSYIRFNLFLSEFYEKYRTTKNIFFINIVSTIDQRKRFYVRNMPVLSIKIMDL